MVPNTILAAVSKKVVDGCKQNNNRLTVLMCVNAIGSHQMKLLAIGKNFKPRCFKRVTHPPVIKNLKVTHGRM